MSSGATSDDSHQRQVAGLTVDLPVLVKTILTWVVILQASSSVVERRSSIPDLAADRALSPGG